MNGMRVVTGILLMIAGPVIVWIGYLRAPAASACARINSINLDLGKPASCSTTPSLLWFAVGAVFLVAGLAVVLTRSRMGVTTSRLWPYRCHNHPPRAGAVRMLVRSHCAPGGDGVMLDP